jgi:hypothetical protein
VREHQARGALAVAVRHELGVARGASEHEVERAAGVVRRDPRLGVPEPQSREDLPFEHERTDTARIVDERRGERRSVSAVQALLEPASRAGSSPGGSVAGASLGASAASRRAAFLACLSSRRSRNARSRLSFAIVVLCFELDAMRARPFLWIPRGAGRRLAF